MQRVADTSRHYTVPNKSATTGTFARVTKRPDQPPVYNNDSLPTTTALIVVPDYSVDNGAVDNGAMRGPAKRAAQQAAGSVGG